MPWLRRPGSSYGLGQMDGGVRFGIRPSRSIKDEHMEMLSKLNRGLIAAGKIIGQLTILALVVGLFIAPVLAMLTASFYIAFGLAHLIGAEIFVGFVMFWFFVGLLGWYVSPHVRPQISNAMSALLRSEEEDAALSWVKKSLGTRTPGRLTNAIPGESIEAFGVLMERYPTAILDTSKLPLPKANMKCLFTCAWLTQTDEKGGGKEPSADLSRVLGGHDRACRSRDEQTVNPARIRRFGREPPATASCRRQDRTRGVRHRPACALARQTSP
jgi:hypothetical protein